MTTNNLPFVPRVPEATSATGKNRLDRFTKIMASWFNSFVAQGFIVQTGPATWTCNCSEFSANLEGGSASSVYLVSQNVDGGAADAVYLASQHIDGGGA